jgi:hypothetical protein
MRTIRWTRIPICITLITTVAACTLPGYGSSVDAGATMIAATVAALQTGVAASQTAPVTPSPSPSTAPTPSPVGTATATVEPKQPVVASLALCWTGPGPAYTVVSSVKPGTAVDILGVGSKTGWFVIQNPTYHDRCWIEAKNLQLDPYFNVAGMPVFNPPPTPGPKETAVPTPT